MRLVALERLSPYLSMHMKNVQIRGRTHHVHQFEGKVVLDPRFTRSNTLQFRFGLYLHLGVQISLALQHPLDVPHALHDSLLHLVGARGLMRAKEERDMQGLRHV
jgi:hypothetical protein